MSKKFKRIILSFLTFLVGILVFLSSVWNVYADGEIQINGGKLRRALDEAAQVQVVANTMKRCVNYITAAAFLDGDDVRSGEIYYGTTAVSTGAWLEKDVTGEFEDGKIWCKEPKNKGNITKLFAKYVLGSESKYVNGIICDKSGDGPGLFQSYSKDGISYHGCSSAYEYAYLGGGDEYLKNLYEERRNEVGNKYWVSWDNLHDYTDTHGEAVGYWMYRNDFDAFCASNDADIKIKTVSLNYEDGTYGLIKDQDVRVRSNWESKKETNIIGNKLSCKDLQGKLEDFSDSYKELSLDYLGDQCKEQLSPIIEDRLAEYQTMLGSDNNYTEETLQKMRDYMNEWGNYKFLGGRKFIEKTDKGGYKCNSAAGAIIDFYVEPPMEDPTDPGSGSIEPNCANSGAAETLGWILCPALNVLSNAANDVYNNTVEPMLQIQPELFSQNENYGTRYAWGIFQTIANILFVILFLFVIFSQLTGVGIDNYGIKKILPKLILVIILVNLSYYICLICVDLSNILGNSLQNMFDSLPLSANGMATSITIEDGANSKAFEIAATGLTGVALLGTLVIGIWAVIANPAIILSLLVSALGIVIAIFFLFILLAMRQAAIIVLTVLSPVVFVCYLLPNTKKLFDKYIQLGKALLLLYPICGLLVGGGNYVSRLLLSSGFAKANGLATAFTAMIVGIVPIFFIPTLLKGSFAALGNLGARISGVGERLRGGVTRGIRNSDSYKQAQERGIERRTRIRAGYDKNGNKREVGAFGRLMRGGRRQMQRESLRYQKMISDRGSLEATEGEDFMLATETANEMKNLVATGDINNIGAMRNGLVAALQSGDRAKIRAYTDGLSLKGEDGRAAVKAAYNSVVRSGGMTTASARTFADNIMANHAADYKNNSRSMFEAAKAISTASTDAALTSAASRTSFSYAGVDLAGKVTATTIGNMDDDEFGGLFGGYGGRGVSIPAGAATREIGAAAYTALHDQNANIKAERRKYLEQIVAASGYQPEVQSVQVAGGTIDANVTNDVLNVGGTVDVGNEVDVNIRQSRGGQANPIVVVAGRRAAQPPTPTPTPTPSPAPMNDEDTSTWD